MLRTALVTGGNRGIGKEVCRQLAQRDMHVVLASRNLKDGEAAAVELCDAGHESITVMPLDVSNQESIMACTTELSRRGIGIDVLVNNAAVCPDGGVLDIEEETIEIALRTNLAGPFLACACICSGHGYNRVWKSGQCEFWMGVVR